MGIPRRASPTKRILVVEDNPLVRSSVELAVKRLAAAHPAVRVEVVSVEDGGQGWERIAQGPPLSLLVADLYVPVLSGLEIIGRVRADTRFASLPILAMSASVEDARERSLAAGANLFLQKPLRLAELTEALAGLLGLT